MKKTHRIKHKFLFKTVLATYASEFIQKLAYASSYTSRLNVSDLDALSSAIF